MVGERERRVIDDNPGDDIANRDPITGEPGSHPVGTGIGAVAAGAAATAIGATAGPIGAVVGAVVGSVIGGIVGKSAAEAVNPTVEESYWRENYTTRPYVGADRTYEDYQPAYRTGFEGYTQHRNQGKTFEEVEADLRQNYERQYGGSSLEWNDAKYAARDAWDRAERNTLFVDEEDYWRQHYADRPYHEPGMRYEVYQPAYRTGYEGFAKYYGTGRSYEEIEPELRYEYERNHGTSGLNWDEAKYAIRDAWNRVEDKFGNRR